MKTVALTQWVHAMQACRETMAFFKITKKRQDEWITAARERWRNGLPIFDSLTHSKSRRLPQPRPNGPITKRAVIGVLQYRLVK